MRYYKSAKHNLNYSLISYTYILPFFQWRSGKEHILVLYYTNPIYRSGWKKMTDPKSSTEPYSPSEDLNPSSRLITVILHWLSEYKVNHA